ncbi:MAG: excinuclease ABC subunit UvrA [Candidatus Paceibacterota bacterium]|jgi:excinuclease ABC subunit A
MENDFIKIRKARTHNLQGIDLDIPKNKLVVITGVSGSGKSSLAFDTLYAEGQRRYVESLSAYARQFLGIMNRPDVEKIEGLSPAIAISQKSVGGFHNPRSTVGTVTEIYDYLRLLFSKIGEPHCPSCGELVSHQSCSQITDQIMSYPKDETLFILAPLVKNKKGEHKKVIEEILRAGFVRIELDGTIIRTEEALATELDPQKHHSILVVIDRIILPKEKDLLKEERSRVLDSVETAIKMGKGYLVVKFADKENLFSSLFACPDCGISIAKLEPHSFSFNSPYGACPGCNGLGEKLEIDPNLVVPNPDLSINEGAIRPWSTASHRVGRQGWYWHLLNEVAEHHKFSMSQPFKTLTEKQKQIILYGDESFEGIIPSLKRRYKETQSDGARAEVEKYTIFEICPLCQGKRLKKESLAVLVFNKNITELSGMSLQKLIDFFAELTKSKDYLSESQRKIAEPILKEINARLNYMIDVGLDYLTLDRKSSTLAGGEAQRIRLATQIGTGLSGVLYILDEPSIGLHQRDQGRLINILKKLRDLGNSVLVVEHDRQTMEQSDWLIDIGPDAGKHGGKVVAQGKPQDVKKENTYTGQFLRDAFEINRKKIILKKKDYLEIIGATQNNLKNIDVKIPLKQLVVVTGVSGSGKSTLVNDILTKALFREFYRSQEKPGDHKYIKGKEFLDKIIVVDQSPIGRTPRSNPATYTGLFSPIRDLFTCSKEAKVRGYGPGRFSFNVKGGRCETCQGQGLIKVEMQFLSDVYVECENCHGARYEQEILDIAYNGKNIADILDMTVSEGKEFFSNIPVIKRKLEILEKVGLGYIHLGQAATTLSGGEAQRIKLAKELSKVQTTRTLYILDEPTTGLHQYDIKNLMLVLDELVKKGNSVVVIEHNIEVIRLADWVIDLGPEGGDKGGEIVAEGTPEQIAKNSKSWTGKYI